MISKQTHELGLGAEYDENAIRQDQGPGGVLFQVTFDAPLHGRTGTPFDPQGAMELLWC